MSTFLDSVFQNETVEAPQISKLKKFYNQYREYVRVDLVMYATMILLIILYGIYTLIF